jgi:hypothetical protein
MAAITGLSSGALALLPAPAHAAATSFTCQISAGLPTTIASTDTSTTVSVIRWTSNAFDGAGWTPERRCQEVSQRFETYRRQNRLTYITTGRINGLPVICTTASDGGACDGLLYTLKPGQDPTLALQRLFDVRTKARGPLNETQSRLYLSVDDLLKGNSAPAPTAGASTSASVKPLW